MSHEEKYPSNLSPSPDGLPPCPTFVRKPGAPFPPLTDGGLPPKGVHRRTEAEAEEMLGVSRKRLAGSRKRP